MAETEYYQAVNRLESGLSKCAKRSFEPQSTVFVDGGEIQEYYMSQWKLDPNRLRERTPLQLERDKILYSQGMRKQTEKYHVLYNGQRRIVRSYATHTMKMAQVTRAICRGLGLNQDFAEAVALGAKLGAVPFVHAAKHAMNEWAVKKIGSIDEKIASSSPIGNHEKQQLKFNFAEKEIPIFVAGIKSADVFNKVNQYMPWAAGDTSTALYSSGQEAYWLLCTNPFIAQTKRNAYMPETMYGIWRHSRGLMPGINPFHHKCQLGGTRGYNEITDKHATFESIVVQYVDDITWVIENLSDANEVALLNEQTRSVYEGLAGSLDNVDHSLLNALRENDAGSIYGYFINDFVRNSSEIIRKAGDCVELRDQLANGNSSLFIGLSPEAESALDRMIQYLNEYIFIEPRTKNRTEMLKSISTACIDLIYNGEILKKTVEEQSRVHNWKPPTKRSALSLLDDDVHRTQISMDVLASWGDQEIYDFVGIQAL